MVKVCATASHRRRSGPRAQELELEPGAVIAGRFRVERFAGRGGMGAVFCAEDLHTGQPVALKVVARGERHAVPRFVREAEVLLQLVHPSIVRYVAHGELAPEVPFLAMEWVAGESLDAHLASTGLRVEDALTLVGHVASALASAHQAGIIHRDIKPSNLMLSGGQASSVKLLDFGIARSLAGSRTLTRAGGVLGSVGYMAPEQALGELEVDARADVFALGCLLFECLTGSPAFAARHDIAVLLKVLHHEPPTVSSVRPELGSALDALVRSMLAKDRAQRPADGSAVLAALQTLGRLEGAPPARHHERKADPMFGSRQRMMSLVLAQTHEPAPDTISLADRGSSADRGARDNAQLAALARRWDAEPVPLYSGALMFVLAPDATRTLADRARQAARLSLGLHALRPELSIVVSTGSADVEHGEPIGEAFVRAAEALADAGGGASDARPQVDALSAAYLGDQFVLERVGARQRLMGERSVVEAAREAATRGACLGRDKELALLEATFAECLLESHAAATMLTAPAGAGKTRLAQAFIEPLRQLGRAQIVSARVQPPDGVSALGWLRQLVPDAHTPAALEAGLRARCERGPVLMVLEDLHCSDATSLRTLERVVQALEAQPLLVLGLARPTPMLHPFVSFRGLPQQQLTLMPLSGRSLERIARAQGGAALPAASIARARELADGDAWALGELVRALSDFRLELPESVLCLVQARFECWSSETQQVLRATSLLGDDSRAERVQELVPDEVDAAACLQTLTQHDVLVCDAGRYHFRNTLLREAAYGLLTGDDRSRVRLV
jgi:hypothetical protein